MPEINETANSISDRIWLLVAEDEPSEQELFLIVIKKLGMESKVKFVRDGEDALDYLFRRGNYSSRPIFFPKLIILDIKMPKINGFEVLKRVKSDDQTRHIPVVMFTSSPAYNDKQESYRLGANSYLIKPFDFDDFQKVVKEITKYWIQSNQSLD